MSSSESIKFLHPRAEAAARKYIGTSGSLEALGFGIGGAVFASPDSIPHAIKIHHDSSNYRRELLAYKRLKKHKVRQIQGFTVPQLLGKSDSLLAIEMSIVTPPYLLDFANAHLDRPPDFSVDVMADWWSRMEERFDDKFPLIQSIYWELVNRYGLYYLDFKQGNIEFERPTDRPTP